MKKIILFFTLISAISIQSQAILLKDIATGNLSSMPTYALNRVDINGNLLFTVYNSNTDDYHLWNTDGTESGTNLFRSLVDYNGSPAHNLIYSSAFNKVFLGAIESCTGFRRRMYATDGTTGNFNLLAGNFSYVKEITNFNNYIYYYASTLSGLELAYFDGTSQNIIDIYPGNGSSHPQNIKAIGNKLYFMAKENTNEGFELYTSDGTATGTKRLKNINIAGESVGTQIDGSRPNHFISFNNKVYFVAENGVNGRELWVTDGTGANTKMVTDMHPGANDSFYVAPNFTVYKNELYFTGFTPATGVELYKINANETITNVLDINPGSANHSYPKDLFIFDGKLFFSADDGTNGYELWYTQNTGATSKSTSAITTALFKNINTIATESSNPTNFIAFDGKMYFTADNGTNGIELWESDGSVGGTKLKQDINPTGNSNPRDFIISNNLLYFSADDGTNGDELWKFSNDFIIGSLSPNDDAIDVALSGENLKIMLNKEIVKGIGNITIYKSSDDSVFETINVTSSNVTINSNTAVISPTLNFSAAEDYYVFIDNGALKDGRNNSFSGISDKTIWNFKAAGIQNQTITFNVLADKTFGDADFQLTATASSNLAVSYTSSNTNVATINGNTVTIVGAGNTTITASQAGNANYNAAVDVSHNLTIDKANQSISMGSFPNNKIFGDPDYQLNATSSSNLAVTYSSSNTNAVNINGNVVSIIAAGTTIITASQTGNANYNPASDKTQILTVSKASQTITFNAIPNKTFGDADFNLAASSTSNLAISYTSSDLSVATITGNVVTIVGAGNTTITANQSGNTNYAAATDVSQNLTINKAVRVVTIDPIPTKTFGDPNFFITSSVVGGVPQNNNTFYYFANSSTSNVATLNVNTGEVSIIGTGTVDFSIEYRVEANYVRTDVAGSFTVNKADQTITFDPISDVGVNAADFNLTATSNSSLPISYISSNPSVASINGNVVDVLAVGSTTINASQIGNNNYNAAQSVSQTLTVSNTASIDDFNNLDFEIFPNPVSSSFEIKSEIKIDEVEIYNLLGQKVKQFINPKNNKFSVDELKTGVYLIKIHSEKGVATSKILKSF